MDRLEGNDPIERRPVLLRMSDVGRPSITLGGSRCSTCGGSGYNEADCEICSTCVITGIDPHKPQPVEIIQALERITVEMSGDGAYAIVVLSVDIGETDFELDKVATGIDPLEGVSAAELDQVIATTGAATSPGKNILEHLRNRSE